MENKKHLKPPTSQVLEIDSNPLSFNDCNLNSLSLLNSPFFTHFLPTSTNLHRINLWFLCALQTSRTLGKSSLKSNGWIADCWHLAVGWWIPPPQGSAVGKLQGTKAMTKMKVPTATAKSRSMGEAGEISSMPPENLKHLGKKMLRGRVEH